MTLPTHLQWSLDFKFPTFYSGPPCLGYLPSFGPTRWFQQLRRLELRVKFPWEGSQSGLFKVWGLGDTEFPFPTHLSQLDLSQDGSQAGERWQFCVQLESSLGPYIYLFILRLELILFLSITLVALYNFCQA